MHSDGYGFCDGCRNVTDLFKHLDFMVCQSCLPYKQLRQVTPRMLELRYKRAEISRTRKLLNRNKLQLVERNKSGTV